MKLTIGQMAETNNISKQTLRLYDKIGLLTPIEINEETGYRYYSYKQCAKLDLIIKFKQMGMSLKEISEFFESQNTNFLTQKLKQHIDIVENQISELVIQKKSILRGLKSIERYSLAPKDGTITVEFIPRRVIYKMYVDTNFYDYDISMYERILRQFKKNLMSSQKAKLYLFNVGTRMNKSDFLNQKYISHELFVFVEEDDFPCQKLDYIESGLFLCIYCDNFDKEKNYIEKLLNKIHEENYEVVGDYICETITEIPFFNNDDSRNMFIRLQIPIKIK